MWREMLSFGLWLALVMLTAFGGYSLFAAAGLQPWASWIMGVVITFGIIDILNRIEQEAEDAQASGD